MILIKYIFWSASLSLVLLSKSHKSTIINKLSQHSFNKKSKVPIESNVDDIKESTDFAEREKKWKQIMSEGEMLPEHENLIKNSKTDYKKGEIPHLEKVIIPEPEMMSTEKRAKIEFPLLNVPLKRSGNNDELNTADEDIDESGSGSGELKVITEAENHVIKSEAGYEPEKENTKSGKRRGSMKCEKKCSVPLEYHECAHPRCDFKIGTIKDLCFFLCKHQKERCEDVCVSIH
ncbi:uncharacterized protein LOC100210127 isoform X1 [Hydra vulgaris]|uniref:Uncharacterized protein LOC100210127 isoform X1 n=1 Tax=Hydra vulgaris TaxID=6087 RepID=A0ABM4C411_HYDVU